jgi:hypothetical protein
MNENDTKNFAYCVMMYDSMNLHVSSHNKNMNQSVRREDIESVNSFYNVYLNKLPFQYCFRMAAIGVLGFILAGVMYFNNIGFWKVLIWLSWGFFVGGTLMLFIDIFIDGFFGLKIAYRFFANILGHKGYNIVVKNKSGNNVLEFFAEESEKSQITNFIKSLKKESINEVKNPVVFENNNDKFIKIEKLAELHMQGLLSDEEFQKMKSQLLDI